MGDRRQPTEPPAGAVKPAPPPMPPAIAAAVSTGRPELVRLGEQATPAEVNALAEGLVRELHEARAIHGAIADNFENALTALHGACAQLERVGEALLAARTGASLERVRATLHNPAHG